MDEVELRLTKYVRKAEEQAVERLLFVRHVGGKVVKVVYDVKLLVRLIVHSVARSVQ